MRKTILLADDSVTIQKVVELTFLDEDFEVIAVSNGTQALARIDETAPDLIIADVHMPGASGFEVCRQAKRQRPGTPVLLLVGTFEPFDPAEATAAGADDYLKKPFDSQELLRRSRDLIARGGPSVAAPAAPAAAPAEAEPESAFLAWGGDAFSLDGDGSTLVEPPEDLAVPPEVPRPALADSPVERPADLPFRVETAPAPPPISPGPAPTGGAAELRLADADIERIARRVVELLAPQILREVAWEVVPDLAEVAIRSRIRELEAELE